MKLLNFSEKAAEWLKPSLRDAVSQLLSEPFGPLRAEIDRAARDAGEKLRVSLHIALDDRAAELKSTAAVAKQGLLDDVRTLATNIARAEARNAAAQTPPGGQFDFPQAKIREIAEEVIEAHFGNAEQFRAAVGSIAADEAEQAAETWEKTAQEYGERVEALKKRVHVMEDGLAKKDAEIAELKEKIARLA